MMNRKLLATAFAATTIGFAAVPAVAAVDVFVDIAPPAQQTPEGLAAFQKGEIDKWWPIIKAANIKIE